METQIRPFIDPEGFKRMTDYVDYLVEKKALPPNIQNAGQYLVQLQTWEELWLTRMQATSGITIINGVPTVFWQVAASLMKKFVDWDIVESTSKLCKIKIRYKDNPERTAEFEYKIEEAEHADLTKRDNWKKYPQDMLYYKALARARKRFCPDVMNWMAIYEDYQDVVKTEATIIDADESDELIDAITSAETLEQLEWLKTRVSTEKDKKYVTAYAKRQIELKNTPLPSTDASDDTTTIDDVQTDIANITEQAEPIW